MPCAEEYALKGAGYGFGFGVGLTLVSTIPTGGGSLAIAAGTIVLTTSLGTAIGGAYGKLVDVLHAKKATPANAEEPEPTAGDIISKEKKGSINRVFPEEMRDKTRRQIEALAREGDRAARTAKKLLTDKRFNKDR